MMNDQNMGGLMGAGSPDTASMPQDPQAPQAQDVGQPQDAQPQGGQVDVKPILDGIKVPPNLKPMYDKIVIAGMRIMFSKGSHQLFTDQLQKEGPLAQKISTGVVGLMYLLWNQSNKSLPPQLMIPATTALTVQAFDYVQKTGNPEATKEVLGEAIQGSLEGVMNGFGAKLDDLQNTLQNSQNGMAAASDMAGNMPQGQDAQASAAPAPGGGLMDAGVQNG